jgi:histone-lysine N-methyltransferase SETMAR
VFTLPKGLKFHAGYYTYATEIRERIKNWRKGQGASNTRKMIVLADNARPHTVKLPRDYIDANRMTQALHPRYSPDIAPSNFFLFGNVKRHLSGCCFNDSDGLLTVVQEILDGFHKPTLIKVFEKWVRRLEQDIDTQGEYVE